MARYISLLHLTDKGAKEIKNSTNRARAFDKLAAKSGVKVEAQYWTIGKYDGVLILSAATEQQVLRVLASLAALGNVRTTTTQAFGDKEFDALIGG